MEQEPARFREPTTRERAGRKMVVMMVIIVIMPIGCVAKDMRGGMDVAWRPLSCKKVVGFYSRQ